MSSSEQTPAGAPAGHARLLQVAAYWPALLTALLSSSLVLGLAWSHDQERQASERARVLGEVLNLRERVEALGRATFTPTANLVAMIELDGAISEARFTALATQAQLLLPHMRSIGAAPDDVLRFIYPLDGNQALLNLDLRQLPEQYSQIEKARRLGQAQLSGPLALRQGGMGLIQRSPVFIPQGDKPARYWGSVSLVADLKAFVEASGLSQQADLHLALYELQTPPVEAAPEQLLPGPLIWAQDGQSQPATLPAGSINLALDLPGARWLLSASPMQTSHALPSWVSLEMGVGMLASLGLSGLVALLVYRRRQLQQRNQALSTQLRDGQRIQAELEEAQLRFRSLTAMATDWVWEQDEDLRFTFISRIAEEATQVPSPTILGHKRWESPSLLPGTDWASHIAMLERHESFRDFEYAQLTPEGGVRHISISGAPVFDKDRRFCGYRGIGRNITEAKLAEQALRDSQTALSNALDRLQAVLDAAMEFAIVATDLQGRITLFNLGAERMLGYEQVELLGRPVTVLHLPAELAQHAEHLSAEQGQDLQGFEALVATARHQGSESRNWTFVRKDGSQLEVSLVLSSVRDPAGHDMGFLGIARDISQQRQAERALVTLNAELEQRVARRTHELSDALQHLRSAQDDLLRSEKMAALGSLVAGVAHELNTPLGNCLTTASTLDERMRELRRSFEGGQMRRSELERFLDDGRTACGILLSSMGTANELVAHFKQVSVDQTSAQRRVFELSDVVADVLSVLRPRLRKSTVRTLEDIQLPRPIDGYPGPLGQLITNLLMNALLHAFPEPLDPDKEAQICLRAWPMDELHFGFSVSDNGQGMRAEVRRRAFDPFFTTKMGRGGTGLGLNIVYNISTGILGGQVELKSEPGQGAEFIFRLPYVAPAATPAQAHAQAHAPAPLLPPPQPRLS
ncbi:PAS domain S-box protein [Paucibacter sp. KBW04]|uniref:PAS domain S-box protein n=1 Tax=Paucibacter sp. KBW04 TaxID=2153361 RepID=UPI000F560F67|nr:PAS domain S-box protein [Paucibacter sp. KBW04]